MTSKKPTTRIIVTLEIEGDPDDALAVVEACIAENLFHDAIDEHEFDGLGAVKVARANASSADDDDDDDDDLSDEDE